MSCLLPCPPGLGFQAGTAPVHPARFVVLQDPASCSAHWPWLQAATGPLGAPQGLILLAHPPVFHLVSGTASIGCPVSTVEATGQPSHC